MKPWYGEGEGRGRRYVRIDGEPKHWELGECVKQYFGGENPPQRANLEFLIGLRNKIEHRHLPELDPALYGECQAALLNFEELLTQEFGEGEALQESLAVSLQFSRAIPIERERALKRLASTQVESVREYIERFRGGLPADVLNSTSYSFSVYLVPKVANRVSAADVAVEFVPYDPERPDLMDSIGKQIALIKEKKVPVQHLDWLKPKEVVQQVAAQIPFRFTMGMHTIAWRHFAVRPDSRSSHPEQTTAQYCTFDRPHHDYVYSPVWVTLLVRTFSDPQEYERITGHPAGDNKRARTPADV